MSLDDYELMYWSLELRQAVISVQPEYFRWGADRRLRYRVKLPKEDREAIITSLLLLHGHHEQNLTSDPDLRRRIPCSLQRKVNEWMQPLVGIGEDTFTLNRTFSEGRSLLDFTTLLSYDYDDHCYQEKTRQLDDPTHVAKAYAGSLYFAWARCLLNGNLYYLTLSMLGWHLHAAMERAGNDEVRRLVPHRYVAGPDDGKIEAGLIRWDRRVEAG